MKSFSFTIKPVAIIALVIFILLSCKKNSIQKQSIDSVAVDVINNGVDTSFFQSSAIMASYSMGQLTIEAAQFTSKDTTVFSFSIPDSLQINYIYTESYQNIHFDYFSPKLSGPTSAYHVVDANNQFWLTITDWNKSTHIITGLFYGGPIQYLQGNLVKFVRGKFNVIYDTR